MLCTDQVTPPWSLLQLATKDTHGGLQDWGRVVTDPEPTSNTSNCGSSKKTGKCCSCSRREELNQKTHSTHPPAHPETELGQSYLWAPLLLKPAFLEDIWALLKTQPTAKSRKKLPRTHSLTADFLRGILDFH